MAKLLLNLRYVPDDEAEEVRALLEAHEIDYYETKPSIWGVSAGGIWLRHDRDIAAAERLMADYQDRRHAHARDEYEAAKRGGGATLAAALRAHPLRTAVVLLGIALVLAVSAAPFLKLI
jgi:hypothetical protein